jgi:hypothetical protein
MECRECNAIPRVEILPFWGATIFRADKPAGGSRAITTMMTGPQRSACATLAAEHARKVMKRAREQAGGDFDKAFSLILTGSSSDLLLREHMARLCFDTIHDEVACDRPDLYDDADAFLEEMVRRLKESLLKAKQTPTSKDSCKKAGARCSAGTRPPL